MPSTIKIRRGVEANRASITPAAGEMIFTTDNKQVFIGDGSTAGGVPVSVRNQYQEFLASGTWTKPVGVQWVYVEAIGGGGAGGAATSENVGGGGGGAYADKIFRASDLTATVAATIGAGGIGISSAGTGPNGGDSTFGAYLVAGGGKGGAKGSAIGNWGGNGGGGERATGGYSSGAGGYTDTYDGTIVAGFNAVMGGAGGGGVGSAGTGNGGVSQNGGNGGNALAVSGTAGSGSVAGGGGGAIKAASGITSGSGGNGRIRIWAW